MKTFVFTNALGKIVGTFTPHERPDPKAPTFHPVPDSLSGQRIHELEVPDDFRRLTSAAELHREIASLMNAGK